jgi:thioredoxin 1
MAENIQSATDATFDQAVKSNNLVLVDFWAEWCGPCRALTPKLEEIAKDLGQKITVLKVNIDENPMAPQKFGVRSIPMMVLFKNGQHVDQLLGNLPKNQIVEMITRNT